MGVLVSSSIYHSSSEFSWPLGNGWPVPAGNDNCDRCGFHHAKNLLIYSNSMDLLLATHDRHFLAYRSRVHTSVMISLWTVGLARNMCDRPEWQSHIPCL
jgi:hypothetical protein